MNCNCNCYPFPHRPLGGRCDGAALWQVVFEDGEACLECLHRHDLTELHPYGETVAAESLRDCIASSSRECPVIADASNGRAAA